MVELDRFNYFLLGLKYGSYKWKGWILRCFCKSNLTELEKGIHKFNSCLVDGVFQTDEHNYRYELYHDTEKNRICFIDPFSHEVTYLLADINYPLLDVNETIFVPDNVIENIDTSLTTTTGRLLFNQLCSVYAFGNKVPFLNKPIKYGDLEKIISKKMTDAPLNDADRKPDVIYPSDMDKYYRGTGMTTGLNAICVPSATKFTLTPAPEAMKLAKKLFAELGDKLNDPIVAAKAWEQIREKDMEYVKSDPEFGFLIADKHIDVVRKKLYYCYGEEWSMDGTSMSFITKPLMEGVDLDNYNHYIDGSREGSFSRGALTALAGEGTKDIVRSTTGTLIDKDDCGTLSTLNFKIRPENAPKYIGNYIVEKNQLVELTDENINTYLGKYVNMRTTAYCANSNHNYCLTCCGTRMKGRENTLTSEASMITSDYMGRFMSAMHGSIYKVTDYDLEAGFGL